MHKLLRKFLLAALLCTGATALGSCNIIGPAAYIIEGPAQVDAVCQLADVPTVVYIDDRSNLVNPVSLRRVIADKTSELLMTKEVVTHTISPQDAMSLTAKRERNSDILSMEEIGRMVGAKQLIYVEMEKFERSEDGFSPRPLAVCRVRVIDVENKVRIFPPPDAQESSWPVRALTREVDAELYRTTAGRLQVYEALAIQTGIEIAKLFYRHEARELGGNLNPR